MARGQKDFGMYQQKAALSTMADIGELAARLNALPRYDRLGDVIFLDGFEGGLGAWECFAAGTGAAIEVTADRKATGSFSCKLTGSSDDVYETYMVTRVPTPFSVVYGYEIAISLHDDLDYFFLLTAILTGTKRYRAGIKYDVSAKQNYYYDENGNWVAIGDTISHFIESYNFIVFKFTMNIETGKYSRYIVPPESYDIADIAFRVENVVDYPRTNLEVRVVSNSGKNAVCYLDSVIITANDV